MKVLIVSKRAAIGRFEDIRKHSRHQLVKTTPGTLVRVLEGGEKRFVYLHAAAFSKGELPEVVNRLGQRSGVRVAVFDPEGMVDDPASLFFAGAVDYLSPSVLEAGVSHDRFRAAILHAGWESATKQERDKTARGDEDRARDRAIETLRSADPIRPSREILSGSDWQGVHAGNEYTFWLLFAELEDAQRYVAGKSDAHAALVSNRFRRHLQVESERFGGRLWMWKRYSGLLLFPYDGERCTPIIPLFRLTMNRVIANVERYRLGTPVSYHLALHLGNTIYRDIGRTGEIVSEDVNLVFHLASQFTDRGEATLTEIALSYIPEGLYEYFVPKGTFEGHSVYRMRRITPARE
jgi:hypothetical protein